MLQANSEDIKCDTETEMILMPLKADTSKDILNGDDLQKAENNKLDQMKSRSLW